MHEFLELLEKSKSTDNQQEVHLKTMGINMLPNCLHPNVDSPYQTAQLCIMLVGRIKQYNHKPGEVITSTSFQHSQFSRIVD